MFNWNCKKVLKKELLYMLLCLFVCLALMETNASYVLFRSEPGRYLLVLCYIWFYVLLLSVRALRWSMRGSYRRLLPHYNAKGVSEKDAQYTRIDPLNPFSRLMP